MRSIEKKKTPQTAATEAPQEGKITYGLQQVVFGTVKVKGVLQGVSVSDEQPTQQLLLEANSCNVHCATY